MSEIFSGAMDRLRRSSYTRWVGLVRAYYYLGGVGVLAAATALLFAISVKLFFDVPPSFLSNPTPYLRELALAIGGAAAAAILFANFRSLARGIERVLTGPLGHDSSEGPPAESISESVSATERLVATTADVMVRDFQGRIQKEIDGAVAKLASQSEQLIKSQLAERIDATIGSDIVSILGSKLATQTDEVNQLSLLRQDAADRFVQMRNRALQYAEAARRQSTYFRWIGIVLALGGLSVLGIVLYRTQQQFLDNPDLIARHVEWPMLLLRHGPSYGFVALCEFLALIMFRYQSRALEYMRYFSNEATNVDARHIAFLSALKFMDKTKIAKLIEKLEATERNFLIGKDQRTLELANNENEDRLFERLKKLVSVARSGENESDQPTTGKRRNPRRT